jgi:type VI protein secretion system component VasA
MMRSITFWWKIHYSLVIRLFAIQLKQLEIINGITNILDKYVKKNEERAAVLSFSFEELGTVTFISLGITSLKLWI